MEPIELDETESNDQAKRRKFTPEEDYQIRELVKQNGTKQWDLISKQLVNRTARQCRDRWKNYLSPNVSHREWTLEEDRLLIQCTQQFGPQWATIVKFFAGRTDVSIKNRWNKLQRRFKKLSASINIPSTPPIELNQIISMNQQQTTTPNPNDQSANNQNNEKETKNNATIIEIDNNPQTEE